MPVDSVQRKTEPPMEPTMTEPSAEIEVTSVLDPSGINVGSAMAVADANRMIEYMVFKASSSLPGHAIRHGPDLLIPSLKQAFRTRKKQPWNGPAG